MTAWILIAAVGLDLLIGDPEVRWHPVRMAGRGIEWIEAALRRLKWDGRVGGAALVILALALCGFPVVAIVLIAASPAAQFAAGTVIVYFSIALGSLLRTGHDVRSALEAGRVDDARAGVARLCGRDVDRLDREGLTRATVESLAENSVDGFTAPIFYAALLGPAGAWLYRIANTLDSMVGYKNEKYLRFGRAAARLDDILNFIPARLTAVLLSLWSPVARGRVRDGWRCMWEYARLHPSPNAGWPESAAAGALGLRLGGPAYYFGKETEKPFLGGGLRPPVPADLLLTARLVTGASLTFAALLCGILWL
ncbi:MAG: cobalamin biosynthesis protein CobD [Candidatus Lindowbacteria bacterium RIFCSPLOWO2_12_FULL_62_27]|nr:MAG: cobalamin biosynthesis protein CobD [Candidatus Lindowbacteria bacterium RIFCSPLOWO2_12_FULL_62_27]OGH61505.1 MAG: cobalamin biosynthesis protein CobD [Candidatus Lindowbacteria bacterium RIFCSPLOWO2_02_FULL_62_12]